MGSVKLDAIETQTVCLKPLSEVLPFALAEISWETNESTSCLVHFVKGARIDLGGPGVPGGAVELAALGGMVALLMVSGVVRFSQGNFNFIRSYCGKL